MKSKWIEQRINYNGSQLRPLFCYLEHGLLGDAVIGFRGACDVSFEHMVDGEDLLQKAAIRGADMVHFIAEIFAQDLFGGVAVQRMLANIVREVLWELSGAKQDALTIERSGDDLFLGAGKLSISIATKAVNSILIHFAVNINNEGTPVKTASLLDLNIDPKTFGERVLFKFSEEVKNMREASWKVRPLL